MPKTEEYIKSRFCLDDFQSCSRFKIYENFDGKNIPSDLDPSDREEVKKVMDYLRKK